MDFVIKKNGKIELVLYLFGETCSIFAHMKLDISNISQNIYLTRNIKGYSQSGLAKKLGKSQQWVQKIEKGEHELTVEQINAISDALGVPVPFLLFNTVNQLLNNYIYSYNVSECNWSDQGKINTPEILDKLNKIMELIQENLKEK